MAAYSTIGPYSQGVWLIAKGGHGALVNQNNLPAEGQGYQYYYLGSTTDKAVNRLDSALGKLGVQGFGWSWTDVNNAFHGHVVAMSNADPLVGIALATAGIGGVLGVGAAAVRGAAATGGETLGTAGKTAGAGVAGTAGGSKVLNAAKKALSNVSPSDLGNAAKAIGGAEVAAKIWEWLTTPGNWVRLLEYIGGAVLIFFAVRQLAEAK